MKRIFLPLPAFFLLLGALLVLGGCVRMAGEEAAYSVYFLTEEGEMGMDEVLVPERRTLPAGTDPVDGLLGCLLEGPEGEGLTAAIPTGVTVRAWDLENGVLTVDFSGRYASLSGIALTLADYSVVRTMTQLDGVEAVAITADGDSISYRDRQRLTGEDLWQTEGSEAETEAPQTDPAAGT